MTAHLLKHVEDGVMTLIFNRPEEKNALTDEMYAALSDALASAASDDAVRVVLFLSTGDSFTAGNDLASFARQAERRGGGANRLQASSCSSRRSPTQGSPWWPGSRVRPSASA